MTIFSDLISVAELKNVIGTSGCRIVDCRHNLFDPDKGRADYLEGHLPAAVFADMDKDLASEITPVSGRHPLPEVETFRQRLEGWVSAMTRRSSCMTTEMDRSRFECGGCFVG